MRCSTFGVKLRACAAKTEEEEEVLVTQLNCFKVRTCMCVHVLSKSKVYMSMHKLLSNTEV